MAVRPARPALPARAIAVMALLAALVLAQALGWMHRAMHGAGQPGAVATAPAAGHAHPSGPLAGLFSHDAGTADCKLLDLLAQPGCPAAQAEPAPPALATAPLLPPAAVVSLARVAGFHARGPPGIR